MSSQHEEKGAWFYAARTEIVLDLHHWVEWLTNFADELSALEVSLGNYQLVKSQQVRCYGLAKLVEVIEDIRRELREWSANCKYLASKYRELDSRFQLDFA